MTNLEFRRAIKAEPFVPFMVWMANGRVFEVGHPDFVMCPPDTRVATVYDRKSEGYDWIDLLLVESIEFKHNNRGGRRGRAA